MINAEAPSRFPRIAVLGPGLLGGSIALAVRERLPEVHVGIWARRKEAVEKILAANVSGSASSDLGEIVTDADLVILCVPVDVMPELARALAPLVKPSAVVTDVGSVKVSVVTELASIFAGRARFVGSHPMAGSEQAGLEAARADLFQNAVCIVTPDESSDAAAVLALTHFWTGLGAEVRILSPLEHDRTVALISHLPHLTAAALVNVVAAENPGAFAFSGSGFRDSTRIAAGPSDMWTGIALANRKPLRTAVEAMIEMLSEIVTLLDAHDPDAMNRFLSAAQTARQELRP